MCKYTVKTGLDTKLLINELQQSIKSWTDIIHKRYFVRNCKVKPLHVFEHLLHLAEYRSINSSTVLNNMYADWGLQNRFDISKVRVVNSTMNEVRDKIEINVWKLVLNDITQSLQNLIKGRRYFAIDGSTMKTQNSETLVKKFKYKKWIIFTTCIY